jgi:hypothetical protein
VWAGREESLGGQAGGRSLCAAGPGLGVAVVQLDQAQQPLTRVHPLLLQARGVA